MDVDRNADMDRDTETRTRTLNCCVMNFDNVT
jgi:hypothetical protein